MAGLSPEEIENTRFATRARGYDRSDVHEFLARVAAQLRSATSRGGSGAPLRELGEEIGSFLQHARDVADNIRLQGERERQTAEREAAALLERARDEAAAIERAARKAAGDLETRARHDAGRLRTEAERFRQEARSYATFVVREAEPQAARVPN